MYKTEQLEEFYKRKIGWKPDNFNEEIGHFNLFRLEPFVGENSEPVPYIKRDYFKIMLTLGYSKMIYADKEIEIQKQALAFSNPYIPYKCESTAKVTGGYFCIFNKAFFQHFGNIDQYPVFHPQGNHIFELTNEQTEIVTAIFEKMLIEIKSNYAYKYDVLRNLAFELIHFAMKMEAQPQFEKQEYNAAERIKNLFFELLERQFPIDENHGKIHFRTASEFAKQLNIHVNHLNKALKETIGKTTSQIIGERILQEAKVLLKHTDLNISEVAHALGFSEATHFNSFFKKRTKLSPTKFRNA